MRWFVSITLCALPLRRSFCFFLCFFSFFLVPLRVWAHTTWPYISHKSAINWAGSPPPAKCLVNAISVYPLSLFTLSLSVSPFHSVSLSLAAHADFLSGFRSLSAAHQYAGIVWPEPIVQPRRVVCRQLAAVDMSRSIVVAPLPLSPSTQSLPRLISTPHSRIHFPFANMTTFCCLLSV